MSFRPVLLAVLLLTAPAIAGVQEKVAALSSSGVVLVLDAEDNELVAQNVDERSNVRGCVKPFA